jgi:hypothetical protein
VVDGIAAAATKAGLKKVLDNALPVSFNLLNL